jgi:transposase-like protein
MHLTLFERTASNGASRHQEWLCRDCNPDIQELERDRANKELVRYGQFRRPQPPPHD